MSILKKTRLIRTLNPSQEQPICSFCNESIANCQLHKASTKEIDIDIHVRECTTDDLLLHIYVVIMHACLTLLN